MNIITNWFQTDAAYEFFASLPELFIPFRVESPHARCIGYLTNEKLHNGLHNGDSPFCVKNVIKQFLTCRAIIIGGPELREGCTQEEVTALMQQVKAKCKELGAIYIEVRNFNDYTNWKDGFIAGGFEYIPHLNFHLDCSDEEMLLKNMHESQRRHVKKGLKSGSVIEEAQSEQDVKDYYQILLHLYKTRVKTPLFPEEFFLKFYRDKVGKYLLIKYEGKVIGGIMCPLLPNKVIYEWFVCGLDEQYKDQYPSVLATYAAMLYGAQHNMPLFDFMGAGKPGDGYGVRTFKQRFGGQEVEHGRYLCVQKPLLYWCGTIGVKILKKLK